MTTLSESQTCGSLSLTLTRSVVRSFVGLFNVVAPFQLLPGPPPYHPLPLPHPLYKCRKQSRASTSGSGSKNDKLARHLQTLCDNVIVAIVRRSEIVGGEWGAGDNVFIHSHIAFIVLHAFGFGFWICFYFFVFVSLGLAFYAPSQERVS